MAKPVASRTKSASARAIGSPIAAAAFFSSTRSTPEAMIKTGWPLVRAAEDQRLGDLRHLAADRRRGVGGGAGAGVELEHLEPVAERRLNLERGRAFGGLHRAQSDRRSTGHQLHRVGSRSLAAAGDLIGRGSRATTKARSPETRMST